MSAYYRSAPPTGSRVSASVVAPHARRRPARFRRRGTGRRSVPGSRRRASCRGTPPRDSSAAGGGDARSGRGRFVARRLRLALASRSRSRAGRAWASPSVRGRLSGRNQGRSASRSPSSERGRVCTAPSPAGAVSSPRGRALRRSEVDVSGADSGRMPLPFCRPRGASDGLFCCSRSRSRSRSLSYFRAGDGERDRRHGVGAQLLDRVAGTRTRADVARHGLLAVRDREVAPEPRRASPRRSASRGLPTVSRATRRRATSRAPRSPRRT